MEIGRLAHEVWWESYSGLVTSETINQVLDTEYSPSVIAERLLKHFCFLAVADGKTVGFAEGIPGEDRVVLETLHCRTGGDVEVGRLLVDRMHSLAPDLPMCSDIALGHLKAEALFESIGFSPGEVIEGQIAGEAIVRRRWWLPGIAPVALRSHDRRTR